MLRRRYLILFGILALIIAAALAFYPLCRALGSVFADSGDGQAIAAYPALLQQKMQQSNYVQYANIPQCLEQAVISVEDKRFYKHAGIDPLAVLRVFFEQFRNDHLDHGGSTISQQLARNILAVPRMQTSVWGKLSSELRVMRAALILEHDFSKQEILELYLNTIYFGRGAYGAQAAAHDYFTQPLQALELGECIYLAGLPQAPTFFGQEPEGAPAQARYLHVVATMERNGYLSAGQATELRTQLLVFSH